MSTSIERFQQFIAYIDVPEETHDENFPVKFRGEFITEVPKGEAIDGAIVYNWISWVDSANDTITVSCQGSFDTTSGMGKTVVKNFKSTDPVPADND